VRTDVESINKDNADLDKATIDLEKDRTAKAKATQDGDVGAQASTSLKIGADHAKIAVNKAEKHMDKQSLDYHKKKMKKEEDVNDSTNSESGGTKN